jgi:hypothetical protein
MLQRLPAYSSNVAGLNSYYHRGELFTAACPYLFWTISFELRANPNQLPRVVSDPPNPGENRLLHRKASQAPVQIAGAGLRSQHKDLG